MHSRGLANSDHTTLLLNCYTKLADDTALASFLHSSSASSTAPALPSSSSQPAAGQEPPFDLDTAIRVCRQAGYFEHAVWLASRYGEHHEYLRIQVEDRADYADALTYIRKLGADLARESLVRWGRTLLEKEPLKTTKLLIDVCCGTLEPASNGRRADGPAGDDSGKEKENWRKSTIDGKGYMSYLAYGTSAETAPPTSDAAATPPSTAAPRRELVAGPRTAVSSLQAEAATNHRKSGIYSQYTSPEPTALSSTPEELDKPSPRQFFAHFVDHPVEFINFLETVAERRYGQTLGALSFGVNATDVLPEPQPLRAAEVDDADKRDEQAIWNTLLELYLSRGKAAAQAEQSAAGVASAAGQSEAALEAKALQLLRSKDRISTLR